MDIKEEVGTRMKGTHDVTSAHRGVTAPRLRRTPVEAEDVSKDEELFVVRYLAETYPAYFNAGPAKG